MTNEYYFSCKEFVSFYSEKKFFFFFEIFLKIIYCCNFDCNFKKLR